MSAPRPNAFINVPFDKRYEPLFVALLCALAASQVSPRCVLEIPDDGAGRLKRLFDLISLCPLSFHDLSRVTVSRRGGAPRFNMPFEIGLACGIAYTRGNHRFFVLEEAPFRVQRSLSDLNGIDPQIHEGTPRGMIREILSCVPPPKPPTIARVMRLHEHASARVKEIKQAHGVDTLFSRTPYLRAVIAINAIAERMGLNA